MFNSKATLLIIDDNPDNLRVLSAILNDQSYRVRKAISGEMALDTIRAELPDLILLDIKMPDMDGYAVCQQLKQDDATRDVPIIFLSALDDAPDKAKAFSVGGADYITKPFQAEEVLIRIQHQLAIQHQRDQIKQLTHELSQQQQIVADHQLLITTIAAVHQASRLDDALDIMLSNICHTLAWDYSEAWIAQADTLTLNRSFYNPHDGLLQAFYEARATLTVTASTDWVGQVWADQQSQWLDEITQSDRLESKAAAIAAGLHTALAVPIQVDQQVLAVFTFFGRAHQASSPRMLQLVDAIALQVGGYLHRCNPCATSTPMDAVRSLPPVV